MNLKRSGLWAGLLVAVTLGVLALSTKSVQALAAVHLPLVAVAAVLCATGFFAFSVAWCCVLLEGGAARVEPARQPFRFVGAMIVSMASLAGLLTPMNLGTDVLRSLLGKKYLGVEITATAAASVATRECKLHVAFVIALALAVTASSYAASFGSSFLVVLLVLAGLIVLIVLMRSRAADHVARGLGLDSLVVEVRRLNSRFHWRMRGLVYFVFLLGFVAECGSVSFCFRAVDVAPDLRLACVGYGILYFLSRVPVVPLGIGFVETGGFAFFRLMGISSAQAGAMMVLWGFLRVSVPYALAAIASIILLPAARRLATVTPANGLSTAPPESNV